MRSATRLIIHEYAVPFSGRGFGRVAEVAACHAVDGPPPKLVPPDRPRQP